MTRFLTWVRKRRGFRWWIMAACGVSLGVVAAQRTWPIFTAEAHYNRMIADVGKLVGETALGICLEVRGEGDVLKERMASLETITEELWGPHHHPHTHPKPEIRLWPTKPSRF